MNDDESAIRKLVDTWLEGTRTGDLQSVLQLMAEDVVFLQPGQLPMRGREAYAAAQAGIAQFDFTGTAQIQEIRVAGDWAYCWNHLTIEFKPRNGGPGGKRAGHVLSVLHKRNGSWVIVRDANMLTPVP
jgi:uncharacterized protein (TIGR02246 family)